MANDNQQTVPEIPLVKLKFGRASTSIPVTTPLETLEKIAGILDEYNPENDTISVSVGTEGLKIGFGKRFNYWKVFGIIAGGMGLWQGGKFLFHCTTKMFDEWREEQKKAKEKKKEKEDAKTNASPTQSSSAGFDFHTKFHTYHIAMPELPTVLDRLVNAFPVKFQDAALLHLLCMFGALCFSMVRASYLDKELHGPWLQVLISGPSAVGKNMFRSIYEKVFCRIITSDQKKLNTIAKAVLRPQMIVQNLGAGVTSSMLPEILAGNMGVQAFIFEPEVLTLVNEMSKPNSGFSYDLFRKSFDGATFFQGKSKKGAFSGNIPAAFNISCTGVDEDMKKFMDLDKKAGGNANRIAWCELPEKEQATPGTLDYPVDRDMEHIKECIDNWREQFCYTTTEGGDVPVELHTIDLTYLHAPLNEWLTKQYEYGKQVGSSERKVNNTRMAAIAFHVGIVVHMMFNEPTDIKTRQKVIDLTLYIANYVMEGYIHRFAPNESMYSPEQYNEPSGTSESNIQSKSPDSMSEEELLEKWRSTGDTEAGYYLRKIMDDSGRQTKYGWDTLNKEYPVISTTTIRNRIGDYEKSIKG